MNQSGKASPESNNGSRVRHSVLRQLAILETMTMGQLREKCQVFFLFLLGKMITSLASSRRAAVVFHLSKSK